MSSPARPRRRSEHADSTSGSQVRTTFLPAGAWEAVADESRQVERGAAVVLGFDGSRSGDTTALVGVTVEDTPHVFVCDVWERPPSAPPDWQVPRHEVLDAIREACDTYDVREVAVDVYLWQTEMADLEAERIPIVSISQQASTMVPATQQFLRNGHRCPAHPRRRLPTRPARRKCCRPPITCR